MSNNSQRMLRSHKTVNWDCTCDASPVLSKSYKIKLQTQLPTITMYLKEQATSHTILGTIFSIA